jgi:CxxC-x17-CxxC domain-containing protein
MELHQAICADCGKSCEVPFKPNGRKPVYCKDCFARNEGGGESGSRPARDFNLTPKPFVKSPSPLGGDKRIDDMKVQLDSVNYKLEKLIKMLEGSKGEASKAAVVAPKTEVAKTEAPKVVAPAKAAKSATKKPAPKKK